MFYSWFFFQNLNQKDLTVYCTIYSAIYSWKGTIGNCVLFGLSYIFIYIKCNTSGALFKGMLTSKKKYIYTIFISICADAKYLSTIQIMTWTYDKTQFRIWIYLLTSLARGHALYTYIVLGRRNKKQSCVLQFIKSCFSIRGYCCMYFQSFCKLNVLLHSSKNVSR